MRIRASIQLQSQTNNATSSSAAGAESQSGGSADHFESLVNGAGAESAPDPGKSSAPASTPRPAQANPAAPNANAAPDSSTDPSATWAAWLHKAAALATGSSGKPVSPPGGADAPTPAVDDAGTLAGAVAVALTDAKGIAGDAAGSTPDAAGSSKQTDDTALSLSASATATPVDALPADLLALLGNLATAASSARSTASGSTDLSGKKAPSSGSDPLAKAISAGTDAQATVTPKPETAADSLLVSGIGIENHVAPGGPGTTAPGPADPDPASLSNGVSAASDKPAGVAALSGKTEDAVAATAVATPSTEQIDAPQLTTIRTIANGIASSAAPEMPPSNAASVPDPTTGAVPPAARTLTLQLSPAHLGTVNVRMHITGQTLDVELSMSSQQTLGLVSRERDALASALRDQSYDLNSLVIQSTGNAGAPSQDQSFSHQGTGGGGTSAGDNFGRSGSGNGTGQNPSFGGGPQAGREEAGPAANPVERSVGGLFV